MPASRSCVLRLLALIFAFAASAFPAGFAHGEVLTIVAFGDSTTALRAGRIDLVYAQRLEAILGERHGEVEVINAGVGGSHTGRIADNGRHGGANRHATDRFESAVLEKQPDIVVIQFGINDSYVDRGGEESSSRITLDDYRRNLTYFVQTLHEQEVQVVLMTPNQFGASLEPWRQERLSRYVQAMREVADQTQTPLVDIWAMYDGFEAATGVSVDALLLDGVHPNDFGHALVAERLADQIETMVRTASNSSVIGIDLQNEEGMHVVVDREPGQYLGHPTTVLLEDGQTILCVYPKGHGRGGIVYKRSTDGGLTWSDRLETPESWLTSREVPTIHRVVDAEGTKRLIMWSGLYPARLSVSEDDGASWSELAPAGQWGGIVVMSALVPLKEPGHYMALFHDDGRYFPARPQRQNPVVFTLYKTFSEDGGLTWSEPETILESSEIHPCEPGIIRSPDGEQLAVLLRENARRQNSQIIFSNDQGQTFTDPVPLPDTLNGDRHTGVYTPDGRLFISYRGRSPIGKEGMYEGDWVGWVGTYDDLVHQADGQYVVRLRDNTHGYDTAYPGVLILPDGTIVTTTYGHWDQGEQPYIRTVRFTLEQLDALAQE